MRGPATRDPVERVRDVLHEPDPRSGRGKPQRGPKAPDSDVAESFRRARNAIDGVTKDFVELRRRARTLVKGARRPAK